MQEEIEKQQNCLQMREQQIQIMQDMLTELEQNISDSKEKYNIQKQEKDDKQKLLQDLEKKLRDSRQDKELYFAKLQTEETLNDRLNTKINQFQNIIQSQKIKVDM